MLDVHIAIVFFLVAFGVVDCAVAGDGSNAGDRIQPYAENPHYWQYRGKPMLLVGGTHDDNPFNNPTHDPVTGDERLEDHLDLLASAGGNYVRNTMSHRDVLNVYPYLREEDFVRDAMDSAGAWSGTGAEIDVLLDRSLDRAGALSVWSEDEGIRRVSIRRELEPVPIVGGTVEVWFEVRDSAVAAEIASLHVGLGGGAETTELRWPGDVQSGWHVLILPVREFEARGLDASSLTAIELTIRLEDGGMLRRGDVLWDDLAIRGRFDLDRFNPEYWSRFGDFLQMSLERDLIVQIELWDKVELFDDGGASAHKWDPRRGWSKHPFNPLNNVNYTAEEAGLPTVVDWSYHPGRNRPMGDKDVESPHPFFYTVPSVSEVLEGGEREIEGLAITAAQHRRLTENVLPFQEAFVAQVLSVALDYPNVLFTVNNETYLPMPDWSDHWARFVHRAASERGVTAQVGDMRGEGALGSAPDHAHRHVLEHPELYTFIDVSQNNEGKSGDAHWSELQFIRRAMRAIDGGVRPITNTKIYDFTPASVDVHPLDSSIEKFWRNVLGGASGARYHRRMGAALHRPVDGDGTPIEDESNAVGLATFRSATMLVAAFDVVHAYPDNGVFVDRNKHEAYAMVGPDASYAVYLPRGGRVVLDVEPGRYRVRWLDLMASRWQEPIVRNARNGIELEAPFAPHALVTVTRVGS